MLAIEVNDSDAEIGKPHECTLCGEPMATFQGFVMNGPWDTGHESDLYFFCKLACIRMWSGEELLREKLT